MRPIVCVAVAWSIPFVSLWSQSKPDSSRTPVAADSARRSDAPALLQRVEVRATRRRLPALQTGHRETASRSEPPSFELLNPLGLGQLGALLNVSPDFVATAGGGFSLLGGPASANQLTLGGVRMPSGLVIGAAQARIITSPWDVSTGGAAGATISIEPQRGSRFRASHAIVRGGANGTPNFGAVAPAGITTPVQLWISAGGERTRLAYGTDVFAMRDAVNLPRWSRSLSPASQQVLDSLATVSGTALTPPVAESRQYGVISRLDLVPRAKDVRLTREDFVTLALTRAERDGGLRGQFAAASAATRATTDVGALQFTSRHFFASRYRLAHILSASTTTDRIQRASRGPSIAVTDSAFGAVLRTGAAAPAAESRTDAVELRTQATWFSAANTRRHLAQLQMRYEGMHVGSVAPHTFFTAASTAALGRGEAVAMLRSDPTAAARAATFIIAPATSVGFDLGERGSFLVGVRADAWRASDVVPSRILRGITIQPRLGFQRDVGSRANGRGARATLRGGAGRFADWPTPGEWSPAWSSTGGGSAACTGTAVARIDITAPSAPCRGTSDVIEVTRLVAANNLQPVTSTRADLSLSINKLVRGVRADVGVAAARYENVALVLSAYTGGSIRGRLAGEGNRALLVEAASIASNGVVPLAALPAAGASSILAPKGRSDGIQYRVRLATRDIWAQTQLEANYAWNDGRQRSVLNAPPDAAPGVIRAPACGNRHTISAVLGTWIGLAQIRAAIIARSGLRFTPLADRDLNGDGQANDAAFVPNELAETWASEVPGNLSRCIRANSGRAFSPNACEGPWSLSSFIFLGMPGGFAGLPTGVELSMQITNPTSLLAGLGVRRGVSLGNSAFVDPRLAQITAYEAGAQRFQSRALSGFGQPVGLTRTVTDPAGIAVSIRIPLGRSSFAKRIDFVSDTLSKDRSTGAQRAAAEQILNLPNVPELVLTQFTTLQLTGAQKAALNALRTEWLSVTPRAVAGIVQQPVPDHVSRDAVLAERAAALEQFLAIVVQVRALLTPAQLARLEPDEAQTLNLRLYRYAERSSFRF